MEILLFLPGILGSKLATTDGEEVWPPTPFEVLRGYRRTAKLLRPDLVVTGVVDRVCIDVYGSLLDALKEFGYTENGTQHRLVPYAYDWRRDIVELASGLGDTLHELVEEHGDDVEIKLICHSMGGLLARAALEGPGEKESWTRAVKLAIFLATPHEGAPLAFARAIGVAGSSLGLNASQLRQLAEAPSFPSGYQLFPHAHLQPLWALDDPVPFHGLSVFDRAVATTYGLVDSHLSAASALHARLDPARRPPNCRYFSIVSAAHETITRLDQDLDAAVPVSVKSSGDGTVPIQSAAALRVQTAFVEANHVGVAQKPLTHRMVGILLGAAPAEPLPSALDADLSAVGFAMSLSLSERTVTEGQSYEIVVITRPQAVVDASIRITSKDGAVAVAEIPISIRSGSIERISLRGPALPVGYYQFEIVTDGTGGASDAAGEELLVTACNDE